MNSALPRKFKLAAFDLDGTLLAPDASISAENFAALERLHATGVEIVLASGRHPLNMRQFTQRLPFVKWIVAAQGGEASDVTRLTRLHNAYLDTDVANRAVATGLELGFSPVVYLDAEICTYVDDDNSRHYGKLAAASPRLLDLCVPLTGSVFKVLWIGSSSEPCDAVTKSDKLAPFSWVRTNKRIIEIVPPGITKASGLEALARHLGISPADTIVFGDAENDIPMFAWGGTSVAMPHGWPAAIKAATYVAPDGPPETALARAMNLLFSR
jgi:Cof subfamily protein (haloacid dehalogenase superfamily)